MTKTTNALRSIVSSAEIRKAAHRIKTDEPVYRGYNNLLRTVSEVDRTIEMVASTETADRYGDIVRVAGWKLDNFQKNPVFLFAHRSDDPPIGKVVATKKELGAHPALVQTIQFATKDIYPFADTMFKMYKGGFMNATSVGFMPIEFAPIIDEQSGEFLGYEFMRQELYELSAVPVPANPEALARCMKSARTTGKFDMLRMLEGFLQEAVERSVISACEAGNVEGAICADINPAWTHSLTAMNSEGDLDQETDVLQSILNSAKTAPTDPVGVILKAINSDPLEEILRSVH